MEDSQHLCPDCGANYVEAVVDDIASGAGADSRLMLASLEEGLAGLDAVPLPTELRAYLDACLAGVGAEPRPEWGVRFVPCQTVAGHCLLPALPAALGSNGRKRDGIYAAFCDMPPSPGGWTALVSAETAALLGK